MLTALSVRDVVLIERLDLVLNDGLSALTGETGAGKSIVLDALGLALGERADGGLLRPGSDQASVSAAFELPPGHPVRGALAARGLPDDDSLILRRAVGRDGRSRAFVNDQPVGVGVLREIGDLVVEVHGQNAERGLLDPAGHRALLDSFGRFEPDVAAVGAAHARLAQATGALERAQAEIAAARADEAYDRAALDELDGLAPESGEEAALADERAFLSGAGKLADDVAEAVGLIAGDDGATARLGAALRRMERAAGRAVGRLDDACAALVRADAELTEARAVLEAALDALDHDPRRLETIEERLYALRGAARKYSVTPDKLETLRRSLADRLAEIEDGDSRLGKLVEAVEAARHDYRLAAKAVSAARRAAAERLERAVAAELAPLKLERAAFRVRIEPLAEADAGPHGLERIVFEVATNPGSPFGSLSRIASGGELSRFVLALKVALAAQGAATTLIFDEIDRGVGGAVADAVGERLARLAETAQVLVVTHSPQVAARARNHLRIDKRDGAGGVVTHVETLAATGRREEIARMLAGAKVTDEARAAARRLIEGLPT